MTMPIETSEPDPFDPAAQLCEYVVARANAGDDVATILSGALEVFGEDPPRRCRQCGCTDDNACLPPCSWVEDDLCSACHPFVYVHFTAGAQFSGKILEDLINRSRRQAGKPVLP